MATPDYDYIQSIVRRSRPGADMGPEVKVRRVGDPADDVRARIAAGKPVSKDAMDEMFQYNLNPKYEFYDPRKKSRATVRSEPPPTTPNWRGYQVTGEADRSRIARRYGTPEEMSRQRGHELATALTPRSQPAAVASAPPAAESEAGGPSPDTIGRTGFSFNTPLSSSELVRRPELAGRSSAPAAAAGPPGAAGAPEAAGSPGTASGGNTYDQHLAQAQPAWRTPPTAGSDQQPLVPMTPEQKEEDARRRFILQGGSEASLHRAQVKSGTRPAIDARSQSTAYDQHLAQVQPAWRTPPPY